MARSKIPNPLARRHLIEGNLTPAQATTIARAYLDEERDVEAIDFLRIAGDDAELESLRTKAVEQGDVFLLRAVSRAQERPPLQREWQAAAVSADAHGLELYAVEARRQAERGDEPA